MREMILKLATGTTLAVAILGAATTARCEDKPAPAPATKPDKEAAKFYGAITAVDADAKTFTIDNQVYNVVAETQMTQATDDKPATLADAKVGEPARGSFTKGADGKLNVTKVRFGKKTGGKAGGGKGGKKKSEATTQQQSQ